jgi:hypothetical protein
MPSAAEYLEHVETAFAATRWRLKFGEPGIDCAKQFRRRLTMARVQRSVISPLSTVRVLLVGASGANLISSRGL